MIFLTQIGANLSSLRFLDSKGQNISFGLNSLKYTSSSSHPGADKAIYLTFVSGNNTLFLELPFVNSLTSNTDIINLNKIPAGNGLESLKNFVAGTSAQLTSFNFLNLQNYGHFYTVSSSASANLTTILTSAWLFYIQSSQFTQITFPATNIAGSLTFDQHLTGDKLCYGALINQGIVIKLFILVSNSHERKLPTMVRLARNLSLLALQSYY